MRSLSRMFVVPVLMAVVALTGCVLGRSKSARTFILDPLALRQDSRVADVPVAVVGVLRVSVPGWIDRSEVTGRSAAGQVSSFESARWGEPIPRGIQRVLAENLAALLPEWRVVAAPFAPRQTIDYRVDLTVVEAARQTSGEVRLNTRWAVLGATGRTMLQRRSVHESEPVARDAEGAVAGANEVLLALSQEIAEALSSLPRPAEATSTEPPVD